MIDNNILNIPFSRNYTNITSKTEQGLGIKNYGPKTIKSYLYGLREYFSFKSSDFAKPDQENIRSFLLQCERNHISPQSRNLFLNSIKFYYRNVRKDNQKIEIQSAKNQRAYLLFYREAK